jgi:hypothetical protein
MAYADPLFEIKQEILARRKNAEEMAELMLGGEPIGVEFDDDFKEKIDGVEEVLKH